MCNTNRPLILPYYVFSCLFAILRNRENAVIILFIKKNEFVYIFFSLFCTLAGIVCHIYFFLLALQPPWGVAFYSRLAGFSLLAYEVS